MWTIRELGSIRLWLSWTLVQCPDVRFRGICGHVTTFRALAEKKAPELLNLPPHVLEERKGELSKVVMPLEMKVRADHRRPVPHH